MNVKKLFVLIGYFVFNLQVISFSQEWYNYDKGSFSINGNGIINKNLFTGSADIAIPFYTYQFAGINLGVGISYNTEGMQVDRLSSNIGLGWELSTGGSIQRIQRGNPDDLGPGNYGYWNGTGTSDKQPDVFFASFGGRTVRFLFSKTGELLTIPKSNIKIDRYWDGSLITSTVPSNAIGHKLTFVITDESGNKFYYKEGLRYTHNYNSNATYPIDKWVIDKFIPYDGGEKYEVKYFYEYSTMWTLMHLAEKIVEYNTDQIKSFDITPIEKWYEVARILKIEYPNNINVEFEYDRNTNRADYRSDYRNTKIYVKERTSPTGSTPQEYSYTFNQGYFVSPDKMIPISTSFSNQTGVGTSWTYDHTRYRLKLDNIYYNSNGNSKLYYSFQYDDMPLPERIYGGRDIYGFSTSQTPQYNTLLTNPFYTTLPVHTWPYNSTNYYGMDRSVTATYNIKACILEKIINGQKGEISLGYISGTGNIGGGLILNEINYYDGYNHDNDVSNSIVYSDPLVWQAQNVYYEYYERDVGDCNSNWEYRLAWTNSGSVLGRELNGSNKGFKIVNDYVEDKNANQVSRTKFTYSGFASESAINNGNDNNWLTSGGSFGTAPYSNKQFIRFWGAGLPLTIEHFDYANNLIKKVSNKYDVTTEYKNVSDFIGENNIPSYISCYNNVIGNYSDTYYPFTGTTTLTEQTEDDYVDGTNYIRNTITYGYDNKANVISNSYVNTKGQSVTTRYFYNYNWSVSAGGAIDQYNSDGLKKLIYSVTTKDNNITALSLQGLNNTSGIFRPNFSYTLAVQSPISYAGILSGTEMNNINLGSSISNFRIVGDFTKYDDKGFLLEQNDHGNYESFIWDNVNGTKIAEASNAKHEEIGYCGFESNYTISGLDYNKGNWGFSPNAISTQYSFLGRASFHCSSSAQTTLWTTTNLQVGKKYIISFWMKGGGSVDFNDGASTVSKSVIYSYNGWVLYKTEFIAQAATIGMWGEAYIDELRLYPADGFMQNCNYLPLTGKTSEVDINDNAIYYEYDDFRNLSLTRDFRGNIISKIKNVTQDTD